MASLYSLFIEFKIASELYPTDFCDIVHVEKMLSYIKMYNVK